MAVFKESGGAGWLYLGPLCCVCLSWIVSCTLALEAACTWFSSPGVMSSFGDIIQGFKSMHKRHSTHPVEIHCLPHHSGFCNLWYVQGLATSFCCGPWCNASDDTRKMRQSLAGHLSNISFNNSAEIWLNCKSVKLINVTVNATVFTHFHSTFFSHCSRIRTKAALSKMRHWFTGPSRCCWYININISQVYINVLFLTCNTKYSSVVRANSQL